MKKVYILMILCFAAGAATIGCDSQMLRTSTKSYQCRSRELPDPQSATDFVAVSRYHYNAGEMDCALAAAEEAVRLAPTERALSARGFAHFGLKDDEAALRDFEQAIGLNPKFPEAYDGRAQLRERRGELDKAIGDLSTVIELAERDREFRYLFVSRIDDRGNLYFQKGDYESALKDFDRAVALEPDFYLWYKDRAKAHRQLGNVAAAESDEARAVRLKALKDERTENGGD